MSTKDDMLYFGHMLDMCRKISERAGSMTRDQFEADETLRLALLHLVQTIGEAARRVSSDGRAAHAEIPWRDITGMRHRIVHDYMEINEAILWEVVTRDVPALLITLEKINPPEDI